MYSGIPFWIAWWKWAQVFSLSTHLFWLSTVVLSCRVIRLSWWQRSPMKTGFFILISYLECPYYLIWTIYNEKPSTRWQKFSNSQWQFFFAFADSNFLPYQLLPWQVIWDYCPMFLLGLVSNTILSQKKKKKVKNKYIAIL